MSVSMAEGGRQRGLLVLAILAAGCAFLFRFITYSGGFANDHFVQLSRAQAMLAGDLPLHDYTEEGVPLTVALSAASQLILGEGPFSELILTLVSLGIAAAVTCYVAGRVTGSLALGGVAATLQIVASPRLYSHPKVLIYPILFLVGWAYLRRPRVSRLAALGIVTAVAFLLRHDHGVYCAVGSVTAVALAHVPQGVGAFGRRCAALAAITLLCIAPYLAYVQYERGLTDYFTVGLAISRGEAGRANLKWPDVQPIRAGAVMHVLPRPRESLAPIAVRWRDGVSQDERRRQEQALDLRYGEERDDGKSWRYWIDPGATAALRALVQMPGEVADTQGFDRASLRLDSPPSWARRVVGTLGLDRLQAGPPLQDLFSQVNSTAILFFTLWLLPPVGLIAWAVTRRTRQPPPTVGAEILLLIVITMVTTFALVREPNQNRVADGFGTAPILGVWLAAFMLHARHRSALLRGVSKTVAMLTAVLAIVTTSAMSQIGDELPAGVWESSSRMAARVREVVQETRAWPWRRAWPQGQGIALIPYLNRCTQDGDRLLVTWNAPEFNVFSRRPFAGGETLLVPVFRPPATYEAAVIARLQRQNVPIVLSDVDQVRTFDDAYPRIRDYLSERYRQAGVVTLPGGQHIAVSVDRERMPQSVDREFGLPCFSDRGMS